MYRKLELEGAFKTVWFQPPAMGGDTTHQIKLPQFPCLSPQVDSNIVGIFVHSLNGVKLYFFSGIFLLIFLMFVFLQNDSRFLSTIHEVYLQVLTKNTDNINL